MKLSKLIENLQAIQKEYGDLDCIYFNGDDYMYLQSEQCVGIYDGECFETFSNNENESINTVCMVNQW